MRADRLLSLLLVLQAKGRTTASRLAEELEVSVRTVYRDLQALAAAGVPVYAESGPGGGCQLLPGYRSPLDGLTPDEADALLVLGVPGPLRQLGLAEPAAAARARVSRAAGARRREATLVHLDMPRWFHPVEQVPFLPALADAVRRSRRVTLGYRSAGRGRPNQHGVEPLGLVNKAGVWYLVARSERGESVYRVGRVSSVEDAGESFRRPAGFDLERFWEEWSEEFVSSRPRLAVTVRLSPKAATVLPEVLGDGVLAAIASAGPPDDEGRRTTTLSFEHAAAAAGRLVALADLVEVMEPVEVRRRIAALAEAALETYAST